MDGFTYTNIFQTKGIEYLVIIGFLLLLIPFWIVINRKAQIFGKIRKVLGTLNLDVLKVPQGVYYGQSHTWAFLEKSGLAQVGMDDLLVHLTGKVNFSNLLEPGEIIRKGQQMAEIEQDGKKLRVYAPISGKIVDLNGRVQENPDILGRDPYSDGWLYRLDPINWKAETRSYHFGTEARNWFNFEIERFKDFVAVSAAKNMPEESELILQSGGELIDHTLQALPGGVWQDFQKEFLDHKG
jgi:glycine cleavage system H protein